MKALSEVSQSSFSRAFIQYYVSSPRALSRTGRTCEDVQPVTAIVQCAFPEKELRLVSM